MRPPVKPPIVFAVMKRAVDMGRISASWERVKTAIKPRRVAFGFLRPCEPTRKLLKMAANE